MDITQLFINQISSVIVTAAFLWYLIRKDKGTKDTNDKLTEIIENHLTHELKTQKDLTKTMQKLTDLITQFCKTANNTK